MLSTADRHLERSKADTQPPPEAGKPAVITTIQQSRQDRHRRNRKGKRKKYRHIEQATQNSHQDTPVKNCGSVTILKSKVKQGPNALHGFLQGGIYDLHTESTWGDSYGQLE